MDCKNCGSKMEIDDRDIKFKGCEDIWWLCPNCDCSGYSEIRYNRTVYKSQCLNDKIIYRWRENELDGSEFDKE